MRRHTVVLSTLCILSSLAFSQSLPSSSKPSPQDMQKMMDSSQLSMLTMFARMNEVQLETQLKLAERPETAESIATFKKNLFEALRRKGFTAEQSLQMVNATALPAAAPGGK